MTRSITTAARPVLILTSALASALVTALAGALVAVPAEAASAPRGGDAYAVRLMAALETCQKTVRLPEDPATVSKCVRGLAAPSSPAEFDLFRIFTDCLAQAAGSDSMYPGIDPDEVNKCLEDWDVY